MKIKFITSNRHKFEELIELVPEGIEFEHHAIKYPEIQAETTQEIAVQSAATVMTYIDPPLILEDSGLFVSSLGGFPGPYSSYVYKTIGWQGLLKLIGNSREAIFYSVIAYVDTNRKIHIFRGEVKGKIALEGKGKEGFGFDPIFIPEGFNETYAEMGAVKNKMSHRTISVRNLINFLTKSEKD